MFVISIPGQEIREKGKNMSSFDNIISLPSSYKASLASATLLDGISNPKEVKKLLMEGKINASLFCPKLVSIMMMVVYC